MPTVPLSISQGVENLLKVLEPSAADAESGCSRSWPPHLVEADVRASNNEGVLDWLRRSLTSTNSNLARIKIDDGLGAFATVRYSSGHISYANVQVIIDIGENLDTVFDRSPSALRYLRLDYHPENLGQMFSEYVPHIHSSFKGPPRFPLHCPTGNVLADFFDYIYRGFLPSTWEDWARIVFDEAGEDETIFDPIAEAYRTNGQGARLLARYADALAKIRLVTRRARDATFPFRIDTRMASYLNYD